MLGICRSRLGDSPMRAWRTRTRTGQLKEAVFQRVREVLFCQAPCSRSELTTARQLGGHRNTTLCPHGLSPGVLCLALIGGLSEINNNGQLQVLRFHYFDKHCKRFLKQPQLLSGCIGSQCHFTACNGIAEMEKVLEDRWTGRVSQRTLLELKWSRGQEWLTLEDVHLVAPIAEGTAHNLDNEVRFHPHIRRASEADEIPADVR